MVFLHWEAPNWTVPVPNPLLFHQDPSFFSINPFPSSPGSKSVRLGIPNNGIAPSNPFPQRFSITDFSVIPSFVFLSLSKALPCTFPSSRVPHPSSMCNSPCKSRNSTAWLPKYLRMERGQPGGNPLTRWSVGTTSFPVPERDFPPLSLVLTPWGPRRYFRDTPHKRGTSAFPGISIHGSRSSCLSDPRFVMAAP